MSENAPSIWDDAIYLASAQIPALSRDARPTWWNPGKVIRIMERIETRSEYSAALMSCLSMLRPELFHPASDPPSHAHESDCWDGESLSCDHQAGDRECAGCAPCFIRNLADAALQDDALRIVIDGRSYRLMHQYGMWFVIGLDAGEAHQLVHGDDLIYLVKTIGANTPLYRIDQDLPRRRIEVLAAIEWRLKDARPLKQPGPGELEWDSMNVAGGRA